MNFRKLLAAGILSLSLVAFVGCGDTEDVEDIDPEDIPEETPAEDEDIDD